MNRLSFLNVVIQFAGILNESRKLFLKNKKLMFSVLLFPLLLNSIGSLFGVFVLEPEITNLTTESSLLPTKDPTTPEHTANLTRVLYASLRVIVFVNIVALVPFIVNLISDIVIVHISALTHKDENIKIKEITVLTTKSWKGPLVTKVYISFCYFLLFLISTKVDFMAAKLPVLYILFAVFESYLAIIWNLSMVISILEDTYGFQALRKAAKIAKGMKPKLFLLNLFFGLLSFGLPEIKRLIDGTSSFPATLISSSVLVCLVFVVKMFQLVTYTVAYFQCKQPRHRC